MYIYRQLDAMDCGPTCLRMVAAHYGRKYSLPYLRERSYISREGVSLLGISEAAENIGFETRGIKTNVDLLTTQAPLPCVIHWRQNHFVVLHRVRTKRFGLPLREPILEIADPAAGNLQLTKSEFLDGWASDVVDGKPSGVALLLAPTPAFYEHEQEQADRKSLGFLLNYLRPHKGLLGQVILGLLLAMAFQLITPFLTQAVVDIGISRQNLDFVWLVLIAQVVLFLSQMTVNFVQSWLLLQVGTRVGVSLVVDFLRRLMRLPIGYFDSKQTGDLMQRINDQRRIEQFLTGSTLQTAFSLVSLLIFSGILLMYNTTLFVLFFALSALYFLWIVLFLGRRKQIDEAVFKQNAENMQVLQELIYGMQEVKLQGSEYKRRWQWVGVQAKLFRVQMRALALGQVQEAGAGFINQLKNIVVSFIAAREVINGNMTLGMMMSLQYIIGQIDAPLQRLVSFVRSAQDARLSLERMWEIQEIAPEDPDENTSEEAPIGDLTLSNVSFRYNELNDLVLNDVSLRIPQGKVTAIVGGSGSGKTTLLKLLLGFYAPTSGRIQVGSTPLAHVNKRAWRRRCGTVMQDGYIFSDTIAHNIAESDERVDRQKLRLAVEIANIREYIEGLPLAYNTMIGAKGNGVSQGQKQRLLIARAAYKDPDYLFFDEATNALDANNERTIMERLDAFFTGKTVVVVAHRLSTVRSAHNIIVLDNGRVVEQGTHEQLTAQRGAYYTLVKNQLELGN